MKTLYIARHAKATWEHPEQPDFDRELTETGKYQVELMATELKQQGVKPDLIVTSPALRALTTAQLMADAFKLNQKNIVTNAEIYEGGVEEIIEIIKHIDAKFETVFLVGHNPNLTWLVHYLCDEARMNMPACGIVGIAFDMKAWSELPDTEGTFLTFIHPPHEHHE